MAPGPRNTSLPNPYNATSARTIYSGANPTFPRLTEQRSPPYAPGVRRLPLSPNSTPSPHIGYPNPIGSIRMDASQYASKGQQANVPPLLDTVQQGQLTYVNGHKATVDIHGTIDKGFFLSEGEWTCYRRNYFSCICSFSLSPNIPGISMQFTPNTSGTSYEVFGFSMTIAAVVAESENHSIELVQHTPKRDKGPVTRPERVSLSPKQPPPTSHSMSAMYGGDSRMGGNSYGEYSQPQGGHATEHTFERIQFKQATANNGKRRAAQQYYHLLVELHAHVGEIGSRAPDQWIKVAHRKSAKMIVRGRSPGHYQTERRGSTSSGPGGSNGTLGSYSGSNVPDYTGGSSILGQSYSTSGYDVRSSHHYGSSRHHDLPMEPVMSAEEVKAIDNTKDYQYYPAPIYEGAGDPRHGIEMFSHRNEQDTIMSSMPGNTERSTSRLKSEPGGSTLPSLFHYGPNYYTQNCSRLEGKSSSAGYYPTMLPQSS